jgi:hypothetical protein
MPRPVVPSLRPGSRCSSLKRSNSPCSGRISATFSATRSTSGVMVTPWPRTVSISLSNAHGSTTTPLPMIDSLPRTTPEGSSDSL